MEKTTGLEMDMEKWYGKSGMMILILKFNRQ